MTTGYTCTTADLELRIAIMSNDINGVENVLKQQSQCININYIDIYDNKTPYYYIIMPIQIFLFHRDGPHYIMLVLVKTMI